MICLALTTIVLGLDAAAAELGALCNRVPAPGLTVAPTAHAAAAVPGGVGTGPVRIDLTRSRRRTSPASWASLAFALRARGAVTVDIEPRELEAGIRLTVTAGGSFAPQMFLADAIENGAAFVTSLADTTEFAPLLTDTRALIADWEDPERHACDGSRPS